MSTFTKLNNVRVCKRCGKPIEGRGFKYCTPCAGLVDSDNVKRYKKLHGNHYKKSEEPLCSCCGKVPKKPDHHWLCQRCWEHEGDDWVDREMPPKGRKLKRIRMENGEAIRAHHQKPNTPSLAPSLIA